MNFHSIRLDYRIFRILLDSVYITTLFNVRIVKNLRKPAVSMEWSKQADSFRNNYMVNVDFSLPELSAEKHLTCKYHVYESTEGMIRYYYR